MSDDQQDDQDQDDEPPEIDDDEFADLEEVADEIEAETNPDRDHQEDVDDEGDQDRRDGGDDVSEDLPELEGEEGGTNVSIGTVYCNGLGMAGAVCRTTWGTADEDRRDELMDDYADIAEQLEIDQCVDDWIEEHGGVDELSPGQATIVLTALWMGMVAMDDPDMIGNVAGEVGA